MTNILYWNIQQFSINLINIPGAAGAVPNQGAPGLTDGVAAQQRLGVIMNVINAAAADIISIVEVQTGTNGHSDLATNSGGLQAAAFLLGELRGADPGAQWRMVPPLWLGARNYLDARAETVAVLYRGVTGTVQRYFTGPNQWTGNVSAVPGAGVVAGNYPLNFNTFIDNGAGVPVRNIPAAAGAANRGGQPENQSAARIFFPRPTVKRPRGEAPYRPSRYGGFRPPYMTSFYEEDVAAGTARTLTVFSVHLPPNQNDATAVMGFLGDTPEIINAPAANEIKILCGDFNLDFLTAAGAYSNVYQPVTAAGYQSLLDDTLIPPVNAAQLQAYRGYFGTHIKNTPDENDAQVSRFLWSNGANLSYYPGYQYVSNHVSIDNILVKAPIVLNPRPPLTIMNLVIGSPFVANPILAGFNPPLGVTALLSQFAGPPAVPAPPGVWPQNPSAANFNLPDAHALCGWNNYGRIRGTSDHFPLVTTL